jgi:hypothetical protein
MTAPEQYAPGTARGVQIRKEWLIMFESEEEEKAQECSGSASLRDMVIRYTKHLVQTTTALSAFYVNVGMTRLLRSYSTSEAQQVYEMLTCRYLGPGEYRRAKATLMDKINQRFAGFVRKTRMDHGELRFESLSDQERWVAFVDECLKAFTPWSTQGYCSRFLTVTAGNNVEAAHGAASTDQNEMEIKCCHILNRTRMLQPLAEHTGARSAGREVGNPKVCYA